MGPRTVEYRESIYVGYRYFDTALKEPAYPFGFGLSYTKFEYSDLKVSSLDFMSGEPVKVTFKVTNAGNMKGAEVAQIYVSDVVSTAFMPEKQLKGFEKVYLRPGETKTVTVELDERAFAFYSVDHKKFIVEEGEFDILVGTSSADLFLAQRVYVRSRTYSIPNLKDKAPIYYDIKKAYEIPLVQFEEVLRRRTVPNTPIRRSEVSANTTLGDLGSVSFFGKLVKAFVYIFAPVVLLPKGAPKFEKKMFRRGALDMPLRNLWAMSSGTVSPYAVNGFITMMRGKFFKGLRDIMRSRKIKKAAKEAKYAVK
jgi:beta-glucosidase